MRDYVGVEPGYRSWSARRNRSPTRWRIGSKAGGVTDSTAARRGFPAAFDTFTIMSCRCFKARLIPHGIYCHTMREMLGIPRPEHLPSESRRRESAPRQRRSLIVSAWRRVEVALTRPGFMTHCDSHRQNVGVAADSGSRRGYDNLMTTLTSGSGPCIISAAARKSVVNGPSRPIGEFAMFRFLSGPRRTSGVDRAEIHRQ